VTKAERRIPLIRPRNRAAWRRWLEKNTAPGNHEHKHEAVWLAIAKKDSRSGVHYADAVEEALCFGWVDSLANKLDEASYKQLFTERKAKSPWSGINKKRIERLIAEGRMTERGQAKIDAAKRDGTWASFDRIETLEMPEDLVVALQRNAAARKYFAAFPPSSRKVILWWIATAKRPETRAKRVAETVRLAAENIRANHPHGRA
jgi:uncharacterized protein YdeI (YjbR/CyaY-like superfamily)